VTRGRILILCNYPPGIIAGQRFRFEQYIPALREAGFEVDQRSFWDSETMAILYKQGHTAAKIRGVIRGFARRARLLPNLAQYDHVFMHLEAAPIGPPVIEGVLFALKKRVVYDVDDAVFIPTTSSANWLAAPFRFRSKVAWTAKHSARVTAVNEYIRVWAAQHSDRVKVLPTTIDTRYHRRSAPRTAVGRPLRIGWTGTHSTARYLELVRPVLDELRRTHDFRFRVICDVDPDFSELPGYEFVKWTKATEIADLECIDIGLMPVVDETSSLGKVGFKAIQYGALEIPTVASDIGSGRDVVQDGVTGYLVENDASAWLDRLRRMLDDAAGTLEMGRAAYRHITATYTVDVQTPNYVALFD